MSRWVIVDIKKLELVRAYLPGTDLFVPRDDLKSYSGPRRKNLRILACEASGNVWYGGRVLMQLRMPRNNKLQLTKHDKIQELRYD